MSARTGAGPRVLTVRRPLVRPTADAKRLLRVVRGVLVRRALIVGGVLTVLCMIQVWLRLQVVHVGYELSAARDMQLKGPRQRELDVDCDARDPRRLKTRAGA